MAGISSLQIPIASASSLTMAKSSAPTLTKGLTDLNGRRASSR